MDENAIRQWLIDCFGPIQGEMAWNQLSNMPEAVRDQLMSQDPSTLPKPEEVKSMMQAFTAADSTPWEICSRPWNRADQHQTGEIARVAAGEWCRIGQQRERRNRRNRKTCHQRGEPVA